MSGMDRRFSRPNARAVGQAREAWTPVRTSNYWHRCELCFEPIPPCKPGSTTGTRGTKAYYQPDRGAWNCAPCREEGSRAELAREEFDRAGGGDRGAPIVGDRSRHESSPAFVEVAA